MKTINRFPIEPKSEYFQPTEYTINSCGWPCYLCSVENSEPPLDIYVNEGEYKDGVISLLRTDGQNIIVDIEDLSGWYED